MKGSRNYGRQQLIFDHIEKFDCDTGGTAECRRRCLESVHCKVREGTEAAMYDIQEWRKCLRDLTKDCDFNFHMFASSPMTGFPVNVTDNLSVNLQSVKYIIAPDTPFRRGIRLSLPPRDYQIGKSHGSVSFPKQDKLRPYPKECDDASFTLKVHEKIFNVQQKFIHNRKFMVMMLPEGDVNGETDLSVTISVKDLKHRHCLISSVSTDTGSKQLLYGPNQAFLVVESHFVVTGYDSNYGFIQENERADFHIGSHPRIDEIDDDDD